MRKFLNRFLLATLAAAAVWACGGNGSSEETGGTGGSGGSGGSGGQTGALGTCGNPIDFNAVEIWDNEESEYVSGNLLEDGRSELNGTCGGNKGNEVVYKWTAPSDGVLTFVGLQSGADVVVYASPVCGSVDDEVACVGKPGADFGQSVGGMKKGESIYIVADSRKETASEYQVKLNFSPLLEVGSPCRTDGRGGVCKVDATNLNICDPFIGFCAKDTAPEITSVRLLRTPTKTFYLEVQGKDGEANATHWYGRFFDKDGQPVAVFDNGSNEGHIGFDAEILGKKTFTATATVENMFADLPNLTTVEVTLVEYDSLWQDFLLFSEPVTVDVQDGTP